MSLGRSSSSRRMKPLHHGRRARGEWRRVYLKREVVADNNIAERVKQIIVEQLGVDAAEVTTAAHFVNDLGADSLDTVELVMALEEEFDTEIPDEQAEKIQTVGQAIEYIQAHAKK